MRYAILIPLALALTACMSTRTSEIVSAGKDSFMITVTSHGGRVGGEGPIALKAANAYCEGGSKHMLIRRTDFGSAFEYASMTLIFSCLDANDPEYQRPDLRRDPTTVIEDQRRK